MCGLLSGVVASIVVVIVYFPSLVILVVGIIAEITQKKIVFTNKRILKQINSKKTVSIWYNHVERFDKVSFPDGTGILYYTVHKKVFGKDMKVVYKIVNITNVNEAYSIVTEDNTV